MQIVQHLVRALRHRRVHGESLCCQLWLGAAQNFLRPGWLKRIDSWIASCFEIEQFDEAHIQHCAIDSCCLDKIDDVGRALCFEDTPTTSPPPVTDTVAPSSSPPAVSETPTDVACYADGIVLGLCLLLAGVAELKDIEACASCPLNAAIAIGIGGCLSSDLDQFCTSVQSCGVNECHTTCLDELQALTGCMLMGGAALAITATSKPLYPLRRR